MMTSAAKASLEETIDNLGVLKSPPPRPPMQQIGLTLTMLMSIVLCCDYHIIPCAYVNCVAHCYESHKVLFNVIVPALIF